MKLIATLLALILLLISSAGAIYGGYHLVAHPDGSSIKLPIVLLEHTPFKTFKIPGILLFITIGFFGWVTIIMTLYKKSHHAKYIMLSGLFLTVWILVQMALSPEIYRIQLVMLAIGITQLLCGNYLDRKVRE